MWGLTVGLRRKKRKLLLYSGGHCLRATEWWSRIIQSRPAVGDGCHVVIGYITQSRAEFYV